MRDREEGRQLEQTRQDFWWRDYSVFEVDETVTVQDEWNQ